MTDYLAWPAHIRMTLEEVDEFCAEHGETARAVFLANDDARLEREQRRVYVSARARRWRVGGRLGLAAGRIASGRLSRSWVVVASGAQHPGAHGLAQSAETPVVLGV